MKKECEKDKKSKDCKKATKKSKSQDKDLKKLEKPDNKVTIDSRL